MLTDIHHSDSVPSDDVSRAVKMVLAEEPDLVVLGGDYVTQAERRYMNPVAELLAPLTSARLGAFAVLGNHDDDREMPAALEARGVAVLKDARTQIEFNGDRLDLAGIRFWTRSVSDVAKVLRGTGGTTLLLAHDPRRLIEAASLDVQLVLSGHTHGGQVIVPGFGAPAAKEIPGARRTGDAREHLALRQPRRRHGVRPTPAELPAGHLDPHAEKADLTGSTTPLFARRLDARASCYWFARSSKTR